MLRVVVAVVWKAVLAELPLASVVGDGARYSARRRLLDERRWCVAVSRRRSTLAAVTATAAVAARLKHERDSRLLVDELLLAHDDGGDLSVDDTRRLRTEIKAYKII